MNGLVDIKVDTHIVIKKDDVEKYLSSKQKKQLQKLIDILACHRIADGKKINHYYVCNTDEPYAKEVYDEIMTGELRKQ